MKELILGCCSTGAKYTPNNHKATGDRILDRICSGFDVPSRLEKLMSEASGIYRLGCRYYHYHARNPVSFEQTTDIQVYRNVSLYLQAFFPDMLISFGASRNGSEVMANIARSGEWERIRHADLPLSQGGAHFVTSQAAIELQIIRDFENQFGGLTPDYMTSTRFFDDIMAYRPSSRLEDVVMETNSTANGNNYGRSSPEVQFRTYSRALDARRRHGLLQEVEWVQYLRSFAMTRFASERPELSLGSGGQINITLLFGFSPRLPFPKTYGEFRSVVQAAKSLELDRCGNRVRRITVTVGAAVLPQHAKKAVTPIDVGACRGRDACAVRRLAAYAAQEDSGVDVLRVGMEDTPYTLDGSGRLQSTDNIELCWIAAREIRRNGAELITDPAVVRRTLGWVDCKSESLSRPSAGLAAA
jgi:uncharacterized protein (DUF849 family)